MPEYIPHHLRPEEFVAVHKNDLTFLRDEMDSVHAALACLLELPHKDHDGMTALMELVTDKVGTLRDSLTPERMQNSFLITDVEIRAKETSHIQ